MPLQASDSETNEDNNITPSDPITLRRVGSSSSQEAWTRRRPRSEARNIQVCFNPPSNPEFISASNGM